MSYLGIVVTSAFASNALLTYGLGDVPRPEDEAPRASRSNLARVLVLVLVNSIASGLMWCAHALVAFPLGVPSLDLIFFVLLAVPGMKFLAKASGLAGGGLLSLVGERADDLIVGSLVFGLALIYGEGSYTLPQALAGSAASGLGYWMSTGLLRSIGARLDLSDTPRRMRGAPAMLLSTGLMALAFMGLDAAFTRALAG